MKFNLTTSSKFYRENDKEKLESIGFKFEDSSIMGEWYRTNDSSIEISSLEELIDFCKEWGNIVFDENQIEIYDDYRE